MHAGDLGRHERKTAPLLRDRLFFRSPRYYEAGACCHTFSRRIPVVSSETLSRGSVHQTSGRCFLSSLFFSFSHASSPFHFSSEYMVGRIQIEIFVRLIPENRRLPLSLRGASIVIFENSSSLSLRTFGHVTVSFDNNRDTVEREKGGLEEIFSSYVQQFTHIFEHDSLPRYRWN